MMPATKDTAFAPIAIDDKTAKKRNRLEWESIVPVPLNALDLDPDYLGFGPPSAVYNYCDEDERLLGLVCRFENGDGSKAFYPFTWCRNSMTGSCEWRTQSWTPPRPIYGLDRLSLAPDSPVVICEGEKSADAARVLLPDWVAVTSPGGSSSAKSVEWAVLKGRDVTIWPDNDVPGVGYAASVLQELRKVGVATIKIIKPPAGVLECWDAADALQENWPRDRVLALVHSAQTAVDGEKTSPGGELYEANQPAERSSKTDKSRERLPSQRDVLVSLVDQKGVELWHDDEGETFATYPMADHSRNSNLYARGFRRWLAGVYHMQCGRSLAGQAVQEALNLLDAKAANDGPCYETCRRVGHAGGRVYLDLCGEDWSVVEAGADGWGVIEKPPATIRFLRSAGMQALPQPEAGEGIDRLRGLVNVETDNDFVLLVAWLVAALFGRPSFPVLTLTAESGTGKSTVSEIARLLVDPNKAKTVAAPATDRDLFIQAANSYVVAFDNLSHVPAWLSDALCRIVDGAGYSTRRLHTNSDQVIFQVASPILMNGISDLTTRGDLAQRALSVSLGPLSDGEYRSKAELMARFEEARPAILGALLDGVSSAVRNLPNTRLERLPRLTDFALIATAAEQGLGWEEGRFMAAFEENRGHTMAVAFESDPIANALSDWVKSQHPEDGFEGTATEILTSLGEHVSESTRRWRSWPASPGAMGVAIRRAKPLLQRHGFIVDTFRRSGGRVTYIKAPKP